MTAKTVIEDDMTGLTIPAGSGYWHVVIQGPTNDLGDPEDVEGDFMSTSDMFTFCQEVIRSPEKQVWAVVIKWMQVGN